MSKWKLVPVEPTEEMNKAGMRWLTGIQHLRAGDKRNALNEAFSAMLAEAPQPPALGGEPIRRYVLDVTDGRRPEMVEDQDGFYCAYEHVAPLLADSRMWRMAYNVAIAERDTLKAQCDELEQRSKFWADSEAALKSALQAEPAAKDGAQ